MRRAPIFWGFVFSLIFFGYSFAEEVVLGSTISKIKASRDPELILDAIPEVKQFSDRALTTYVSRKLARNYPFSPTASIFLNSARTHSAEELTKLKGGYFWFIPLTFLRLLVVGSAFLMLISFKLRSFRTFLFLSLTTILVVGEGINFSRGLFSAVFIPFEGDRFSFSSPDTASQAVEKLPPGAEIKVSEINGDWIKLALSSGRVGWVEYKDGIIESEEQ